MLAEHCRKLGTDFDAIVRSANFSAIIGTSDADVKDRLQRMRDRMAGYVPEAAADAMIAGGTGPDSATGTTGTGDRADREGPRSRVRVRDLLLPGGRLRPLRHRVVRTRSHSRAELDIAELISW